MTILPFGGALATCLSFGGTIMPVRVEDYEQSMKKRNIAIGSIVSFRLANKDSESTLDQKLDDLDDKVRDRIDRPLATKPRQFFLSIGLIGMSLLFVGSQAAMTVIEQGGIIPWWCASRWWMHMWYFMGKGVQTSS
jgi:hypothetical protein